MIKQDIPNETDSCKCCFVLNAPLTESRHDSKDCKHHSFMCHDEEFRKEYNIFYKFKLRNLEYADLLKVCHYVWYYLSDGYKDEFRDKIFQLFSKRFQDAHLTKTLREHLCRGVSSNIAKMKFPEMVEQFNKISGSYVEIHNLRSEDILSSEEIRINQWRLKCISMFFSTNGLAGWGRSISEIMFTYLHSVPEVMDPNLKHKSFRDTIEPEMRAIADVILNSYSGEDNKIEPMSYKL